MCNLVLCIWWWMPRDLWKHASFLLNCSMYCYAEFFFTHFLRKCNTINKFKFFLSLMKNCQQSKRRTHSYVSSSLIHFSQLCSCCCLALWKMDHYGKQPFKIEKLWRVIVKLECSLNLYFSLSIFIHVITISLTIK